MPRQKRNKLTRVLSFKASEKDHEKWKLAAAKLGITFGELVRQRMNGAPPDIVPLLIREAPKVRTTIQCMSRVPPGAFCKRCERIHK